MMVLGGDGNVWFTQPQANAIGRIMPNGYLVEFPLPNPGVPLGIATGTDKNLWVTVIRAHVIYRVTPNGDFTAFPMPASSMATFIAAAPDGTLWFTEPNGKVGRITPAGDVREFVFSNPYSDHKEHR
jgi:virginiamycin B lyase